ncbi:hypothetical protein LFM09_33275 [Lentzea alba]|uniref:hypothetical protein n=1 Tax=Lentzea alba TaxID=2714351 RepID=UPI0039BEECF6
MFVGGTGTSVRTFQAGPEEAHAVLCAVLHRLRGLGCKTTRLGRGLYLCDADATLMTLTLAPPSVGHSPDTYLLTGTVTGGGALSGALIACVEEAYCAR